MLQLLKWCSNIQVITQQKKKPHLINAAIYPRVKSSTKPTIGQKMRPMIHEIAQKLVGSSNNYKNWISSNHILYWSRWCFQLFLLSPLPGEMIQFDGHIFQLYSLNFTNYYSDSIGESTNRDHFWHISTHQTVTDLGLGLGLADGTLCRLTWPHTLRGSRLVWTPGVPTGEGSGIPPPVFCFFGLGLRRKVSPFQNV